MIRFTKKAILKLVTKALELSLFKAEKIINSQNFQDWTLGQKVWFLKAYKEAKEMLQKSENNSKVEDNV